MDDHYTGTYFFNIYRHVGQGVYAKFMFKGYFNLRLIVIHWRCTYTCSRGNGRFFHKDKLEREHEEFDNEGLKCDIEGYKWNSKEVFYAYKIYTLNTQYLEMFQAMYKLYDMTSVCVCMCVCAFVWRWAGVSEWAL